ncbi:MAG: hypothetical protein EPN34_02435 [Burkholderiaceae bacterium]|nr:MAG: hypothetical protein EPN34_02435 [Burkholderiaceae bacterium]
MHSCRNCNIGRHAPQHARAGALTCGLVRNRCEMPAEVEIERYWNIVRANPIRRSDKVRFLPTKAIPQAAS